ncbi:MAG: chemotaxis protein CheA, partial [Thermodesulfobacteriota bacterium]|nr:chemotaxis protein CheA [Thermodesulfobacteriota bacterium]
MTYEIIEDLVEKLSCDFVLADPGEPESLSGLLPILKQIHGKFMELSLKDKAKEVLKARKIIKAVLQDNGGDVDKKMADLGGLISEFSLSPGTLEESHQIHDDTGVNPPCSMPGGHGLDQIEAKLNIFDKQISGFCPGEIPDLGSMLNLLDELIDASKEKDHVTFHEVCLACKGYVENMTLQNINNTKPIEEGLVLLRSLLSHLKNDEAFVFDYSDVLELLNVSFKEKEEQNVSFEEEQKPDSTAQQEEKPSVESQSEPRKISKDDLEILMDFVSESQENLDTIEVNLIELEQDPFDIDIINNIFRPFHTIKGVSGFLSLTKINKLAHTTENLLDSARNGDFLINDTATDAILESVDTLKKLIARVNKGFAAGFMLPDDDIDIDSLRGKLKNLQVSLAQGKKEPLGEILVQKGDVSNESLGQALEIQKKHPDKKIGEILIEEKIAAPTQVESALMDQNIAKRPIAAQVKVSTDKLDDLVDYAGELVIAQSMLRQKTLDDPSLSQSVAQLGQIVTNMQNIAMSMRMIPIKATFMKMIRLVRDLSRKSGKDIALNMVGEETEIDRNVVDALYEPMVHMIRNSCDHGIEQNSDRLEQEKPSQGTIVLRAYHKGGHIIIEIQDDGKGLDKEIILEKAKGTGLITGKEQMTDAQVYNLILQPGFSTAKEITDVSGRGVGMDVVKNGIEKFRGQLNIESSKGVGSTFTISLPLTLAIIDGMLVG